MLDIQLVKIQLSQNLRQFKKKVADYISSYVVSHPEEMLSILDDEEFPEVCSHSFIMYMSISATSNIRKPFL